MEQSVVRGKEVHEKLSEDARQKQAGQEEARSLADRRKTDEELRGSDLCDLTTHREPHLTLSISSDNSLLRWPTLALMARATLRLYFFCSSIRRSSEHLCLCCRPPAWRPASTQQPGLRAPANKKVFSFPFTPSSLPALDWLDCETFGGAQLTG